MHLLQLNRGGAAFVGCVLETLNFPRKKHLLHEPTSAPALASALGELDLLLAFARPSFPSIHPSIRAVDSFVFSIILQLPSLTCHTSVLGWFIIFIINALPFAVALYRVTCASCLLTYHPIRERVFDVCLESAYVRNQKAPQAPGSEAEPLGLKTPIWWKSSWKHEATTSIYDKCGKCENYVCRLGVVASGDE